MKKIAIRLAFMGALLCFLLSCKEENTTENNTEANPTQSSVETNENPKTTPEVNPAHGQPGHRCDIPVGASLSEASNQQQRSSGNATSSPVRLKETTPKINPPHGEPGHDCSVPVGAELNSQN